MDPSATYRFLALSGRAERGSDPGECAVADFWEFISGTGQTIVTFVPGDGSPDTLRRAVSWIAYTAFVFCAGRLSTRMSLGSLLRSLCHPTDDRSSGTSSPADARRDCDNLLAEIGAGLAVHSRSAKRLNEQIESNDHDLIRDCARETRSENVEFQEFLRDRCSQLEEHSAIDDRRLPRFIKSLSGHSQQASKLDDVLALLDDDDEIETALAPLRECIEQLIDDNRRLQGELDVTRQAVARQSQKLEQAEEEARIDALTALPNRRAFDEHINRLHALFRREEVTFVVALLDVDHFKAFNDTHGHETGDKVLQYVARSLQGTKRDTDHVARFGGEEFVILIPRRTGHQAKFVVDRHRAQIEQAVLTHDDGELSVTVSAGVAEIRRGDTVRSVLARADRALYAAKDAGRNQTCLEDGGKIVHLNDLRTKETAKP